MAIGASSPFDHNVFAAASGLSSSPWAKQPQTNQHRFIRKAETQTFNAFSASAVAAGEEVDAECNWTAVHSTSSSNPVPKHGDTDWMHMTLASNSGIGTRYSFITNGYLKLHENHTSNSGAVKLVPANNHKISGAVRFVDGNIPGWSGDITGPDGQYAKKENNEIKFSIMGSGSRVECDVDNDHGSIGNLVRLSDGTQATWSKPNQDMYLKIWSVHSCARTKCPSAYTRMGNKCRTKQCKDNKYNEYFSGAAISDATKCKTCQTSNTAPGASGTGWSVSNNCTVSIVDGYVDIGGSGDLSTRVKTTGCTKPNYNETGSFQVPDDSYCNTCKSTHQLKNGNCVLKGCTDVNASNYNPNAEHDDGSCTCAAGYAMKGGKCVVAGCMEPSDSGYNSSAQVSNPNLCTGECATGYEKNDAGNCVPIATPGCTDPEADNYDSEAGADDGSCTYSCADSNRAVTDKGTCASGCQEGYNLVDDICVEVDLATPDDELITGQGDETTTVTTQGQTTTPAAATSTPNTGLIVGGLAVVGILGFMMSRKKKAAAEWQYY